MAIADAFSRRTGLLFGAAIMVLVAMLGLLFTQQPRNTAQQEEPFPNREAPSPPDVSPAAPADPPPSPARLAEVVGQTTRTEWEVVTHHREQVTPDYERWILLLEQDADPKWILAFSEWAYDPEGSEWRNVDINAMAADRLIVRPRPDAPADALLRLFQSLGLRVTTAPPPAGGHWTVQWEDPGAEKFNALFERLNAEPQWIEDAIPQHVPFNDPVVQAVDP